MISRLEIYIILGLLVATAAAYVAGDVHGHLAESRVVASKQTEADAKALGDALKQAQGLLHGDQTAAEAAAARFNAINKGIDNAVAKFGALPSVVLDAHGCERLSDSFGLRWNTVESLSGGSPVGVPDRAPGGVPAGAMPTPH